MAPVFLFLVAAAVIAGAVTGRLEGVTTASLAQARSAVEIAIGLVGVMAFWLGLVEVIRRGGLLDALARGLTPVFRRLFPDVPPGDPAIAAMSLNIAANMLGLTNAATPFGIEAMRQLDRLNGERGTSTDAMALFLAINTSGVALLPLGVIGLRASVGSRNAAGIIVTTLIATSFSTLCAILAAKLLVRWPRFRASRPRAAVPPAVAAPPAPPAPSTPPAPPAPSAPCAPPAPSAPGAPSAPVMAKEGTGGPMPASPAPAVLEPAPETLPAAPRWRRTVAWLAWGGTAMAAVAGLAVHGADEGLGAVLRSGVSWLPLPLIILGAVAYGWSRAIPVYDALVDGAKDGFQVALRIIPYLVAVLVAVGMFRASGALDVLVTALAPLTTAIGFPAEVLPMALVRPLSGSGAFGILTDLLKTHGPDSFIGYLASTVQGSFETTFYVLAVYGGAVGLRRTRHTVPACLAGDLAGLLGATLACRWLLG